MRKLFFNDDNWDCPLIMDENGNTVEELSVCKEMVSFVGLNGEVYFSNYQQSHYGAILDMMYDIHNARTEKELEAKFKQNIYEILDDARREVDFEGRIWFKYNIIQITGNRSKRKPNYQLIATKCGIPIDKVNILGVYDNNANGFEIMRLNRITKKVTFTEQQLKQIIRESLIRIETN